MKPHYRFAAATIVCVLAITAFATAGCVPPAPSAAAEPTATPAPVRLSVCQAALTANMSPLRYALENGFFAQQGLDVEIVEVDGGTIAVTGMMADEFDICVVAGPAVVNAVAAGEDVRIIAGLVNTYVYSLFVHPSVTTPADLKGKSLAVSDPGSSSDTALRAALSHLGLDPDRDIAIVAIGGQAARLAAVESGAVQGTLISPPQTTIARSAGLIELYDLGTLKVPYQHTAIAATKELLDNHPQVAEGFMKGFLSGLAQMRVDETGAKQVIARILELDLVDDAALVDEAYKTSIQGYLYQGPYPTLPGINTAIQELIPENPDAANLDPADVVDLRVLDSLKQQGFLDQLGDK